MTSSEKISRVLWSETCGSFVVAVFAAMNMGRLPELHVPRDEERLVNPSKSKGMTEKALKGCSAEAGMLGTKESVQPVGAYVKCLSFFYLAFV